METTQADTVIGVDVNVKGNLNNKGSIQINGTVEGEIKSDENITIGETADVSGPIVAKNILISGKVTGMVTASDKLEIDPTGTISGDIKTKTLIFREGAVFNGTCNMSEERKVGTEKAVPETAGEQKKEEPQKGSGFWDKTKKN
jgi:cytoskeletal protein CcmA (bactofilin family)